MGTVHSRRSLIMGMNAMCNIIILLFLVLVNTFDAQGLKSPLLWREDGRCGDKYPLPNGTPGQCDPAGDGPKKGPCCSPTGFCGNTEAHCSCPDCVNYGMVKEPWRSDGRCGKKFPMFNGKPYQCNPKLSGPKKGPCCSPSGFCGNTDAHCACDTCVDFSKEQAGANADESKDATDGKASTEEDESSDA